MPGFSVTKQPIPYSKQQPKVRSRSPNFKIDVSFSVKNTAISGWLYLPDDLSLPVPGVIMNHGFGGTKDMLLESYAQRYREEGIAVLTYDYRHFGASEGEPRQLFSIASQLEDLRAAIAYIRNRKEIDPDKIAVWGTSAGGGYGLIIAAQDKRIDGVVAQCPALDSHEDGKLALQREGTGFFLRLLVHAQRDKGRARFGLSPHKIPIVGKPKTLAMVTAPGAFEGYADLVAPDFKNEVCARVLLMTHGHNPINYAKGVACPVLIQVCEKDNLVSRRSYEKAAAILGKHAEVKIYPIGHFDIYVGDNFEKAVGDQLKFLKRIFSS